jgi:hypothetical protein
VAVEHGAPLRIADAADCFVESTISVNSTVPNLRVDARLSDVPVANSMIASSMSRQFGSIHEKWSAPSISMYVAPGIRSPSRRPMATLSTWSPTTCITSVRALMRSGASPASSAMTLCSCLMKSRGLAAIR